MKTKAISVFISLLLLTTVLAEDCIPTGDSCDANNYNGECCQTESLTTCINPYLNLGSDSCEVCATDNASCSSRTECCSDCCDNDICVENYDECNWVETFWVVVAWAALGALVFGVGGYYLFKWLCSDTSSKSYRNKQLKSSSKNVDSDSPILVVIDKDD